MDQFPSWLSAMKLFLISRPRSTEHLASRLAPRDIALSCSRYNPRAMLDLNESVVAPVISLF